MGDARDVRVMDLRRRACLPQKTRTRGRILRNRRVDHFHCDDRIKDGVARAISHRHRTRSELDWKTIFADFDLEVRVTERPGRAPLTSRRARRSRFFLGS
jgi:hypothetical protein